jgi:hypothetical protein
LIADRTRGFEGPDVLYGLTDEFTVPSTRNGGRRPGPSGPAGRHLPAPRPLLSTPLPGPGGGPRAHHPSGDPTVRQPGSEPRGAETVPATALADTIKTVRPKIWIDITGDRGWSSQVTPRGKSRSPGRPTKLTRAVAEAIVTAIRRADCPDTAVALAGINRASSCRWLRRGHQSPDSKFGRFLRPVNQALAEAEQPSGGRPSGGCPHRLAGDGVDLGATIPATLGTGEDPA